MIARKCSSCLAVLVGLVALAATTTIPKSAEASFILDVTYSNLLPPDPDFAAGTFGFDVLPATVDATFYLGEGVLSSEPGGAVFRTFSLGDVMFAYIGFGKANWSKDELINFRAITNGVFTTLEYEFGPITTGTVMDGVILNGDVFPLTISGKVKGSGESFEYNYDGSAQTLTAVPEPSTLALFAVGLAGLGFMMRRRGSVQLKAA